MKFEIRAPGRNHGPEQPQEVAFEPGAQSPTKANFWTYTSNFLIVYLLVLGS